MKFKFKIKYNKYLPCEIHRFEFKGFQSKINVKTKNILKVK